MKKKRIAMLLVATLTFSQSMGAVIPVAAEELTADTGQETAETEESEEIVQENGGSETTGEVASVPNLEDEEELSLQDDAENAEEVAEEETPMQLVFSGGTKEMLEVDAHTLFYVEAEGNYIRVAYSSADKMQQKLVRATMKQAEEAVAACPFIVRCHRAFLVNIRTVVKVDGNSQGYRLRLEGCTEEVPVSRGYAKEIKTLIEGGTEG